MFADDKTWATSSDTELPHCQVYECLEQLLGQAIGPDVCLSGRGVAIALQYKLRAMIIFELNPVSSHCVATRALLVDIVASSSCRLGRLPTVTATSLS